MLLFIGIYPIHAQNVKEIKKEKKIELRVLPYVNYSETLKFQYGLLGMALYRLNKNDTISPKSLSGMTGILTTNDSKVFSAFNRWFLNEDNWRITCYLGLGNVNSQTYISEVDPLDFYDFGTDATFLNISILKRIKKQWYGGLGFVYNNTKTAFDELPSQPKNEYYGLLFSSSLDNRDELYYPRNGSLADIKWTLYPVWIGNKKSLSTLNLSYNTYSSFRDNKDVLALRGVVKMGIGAVNFERQVVIGGKDIRGYSNGKYRGDGVLAVQGEYRWNFNDSMGMVGFAGVATMYGSINKDFNYKLYPGIGVGYRYTVFKSNNFKIGLDAALGKDDWSLYFRLSEAF